MHLRRQALSRCAALPNRQRGAVMILFVIGMVAIIGIAGLALDGGHMMLSKTRLQNTVDAAALSAAKTLDETEDEALARAAALSMFADNAAGAGNSELNDAYTSGSLTVTVEFSSTLNPFVPGSTPADFVRVRGLNFTLPVWFSTVLGFTDKGVAATAVAGPSSPIEREVCNLTPLMICGDPNLPEDNWGYEIGATQVLKSPSPGGDNGDFPVGPGEFQLVNLGGITGSPLIRDSLAGGWDGCMTQGEELDLATGVRSGPVAQGINTRFGSYTGPMAGTQSDYPPDIVTTQPYPPIEVVDNAPWQNGAPISDANPLSWGWDQYVDQVRAGNYDYYPPPAGIGQRNRREIAVSIGDCSDPTSGRDTLPLLGFGCFFLLQETPQSGVESWIFGQFLDDCTADGLPGPDPTTNRGPYRIQLYRDYSSTDS